MAVSIGPFQNIVGVSWRPRSKLCIELSWTELLSSTLYLIVKIRVGGFEIGSIGGFQGSSSLSYQGEPIATMFDQISFSGPNGNLVSGIRNAVILTRRLAELTPETIDFGLYGYGFFSPQGQSSLRVGFGDNKFLNNTPPVTAIQTAQYNITAQWPTETFLDTIVYDRSTNSFSFLN